MAHTTTNHRRPASRLGWLALLPALALVATACGTPDDGALPARDAGRPLAEAPAASTPTTEPTTPEPTTPEPTATEPTTPEPTTPEPDTPEEPEPTATEPTTPEEPEPEPEPEPVDELRMLVDEAVLATLATGTATTSGTVTTNGEEVGSFAGVIDFAEPSFAGDLTYVGDPPVAIVIAGDNIYVAFPDLPFGATWQEMTPDEFGYPPASAFDLPLGFLAAIDAAAPGVPIDDLGEAAGDEPGRLVVVTLDVELLLAGAGVQPMWFGAWSAAELQADAEIEIEEGRLVRLTLTVEPSRGSDEYRQGHAFVAVYAFRDFGEVPGVEPPPDAEVVRADDYGVPVDDLMIGDCIIDLGGGAGVELVPCDEPHQAEVFATPEISGAPGDPYPGDDAAWDAAADACLAEFEGYVGEPFATSPLDFFAWYPSAETWPAGDRLVICAATPMDGTPLETTVRDRQY